MRRRQCGDGVMHIYQKTLLGFNLFYTLEDFLVFFTIISVQARQLNVSLMAMCMMIDHIHLLIMPDNLKQVSRFMSACLSRYVKECNARTGRSGALFDPRYGSAMKKDGKKIRSAIAYLFNNAVEKHLCKKAEDYKWNFLSYFMPLKVKKSEWRRYMSRALYRAVTVIDETYEKGRHIKYALLETLRKDLNNNEQNILTDYIIRKYFPFDIQKTIGYFKSFEDMVVAINSNTGSEYEIIEHHYCKTDVPYREIIRCLMESGIKDPRSLITASSEQKRQYFSFLKHHTSATNVQIRKFLHIENEQQINH